MSTLSQLFFFTSGDTSSRTDSQYIINIPAPTFADKDLSSLHAKIASLNRKVEECALTEAKESISADYGYKQFLAILSEIDYILLQEVKLQPLAIKKINEILKYQTHLLIILRQISNFKSSSFVKGTINKIVSKYELVFELAESKETKLDTHPVVDLKMWINFYESFKGFQPYKFPKYKKTLEDISSLLPLSTYQSGMAHTATTSNPASSASTAAASVATSNSCNML